MNFDSQEVKRAIRALKEVAFELAYLAVLTSEGIKPLSRWEKPLPAKELALLETLGLLAEQIKRTVRTGNTITETLFSASRGYLEIYESWFGDKPIDKSPATIRFEGYLFGFPPCCVDQFIRHPYAKNDLDPAQQRILFHWACKGCKITPILWPAYKNIHELLSSNSL